MSFKVGAFVKWGVLFWGRILLGWVAFGAYQAAEMHFLVWSMAPHQGSAMNPEGLNGWISSCAHQKGPKQSRGLSKLLDPSPTS